MKELFNLSDAVKKIKAEMEIDKSLTLEQAIDIYNNDWFDGELGTEEINKIRVAFEWLLILLISLNKKHLQFNKIFAIIIL